MKDDYIAALETRLRWCKNMDFSHWSQMFPGDSSQSVGQTFDIYKYALEVADTYYMNPNFCRLVEHARDTIPNDLPFDSKWLQSKSGWLWISLPAALPSQIEIPGVEAMPHGADGKVNIKLNAIAWTPSPNGISVMCFVEAGPDFVPWSYFQLIDGDRIVERCHDFENTFRNPQSPDYGYGASYIEGRETDMLHEIRWVYCALYLMAQRLAVTTHVEPSRAAKRRAERNREALPPIIRVIGLRRMEEERPKASGTPVDWNWQWEVRGHWRNQWFPSENAHRPVFIEAYIKGPDDKPLKPPGHKLFAAIR